MDKRRFVELPVGEPDQELYELAQMLLDMESIRTALGLKEDLGRRDVERLHECVKQRINSGRSATCPSFKTVWRQLSVN